MKTWHVLLSIALVAGCGDDDGGDPDLGVVPIDLGGGDEDMGPLEEDDMGPPADLGTPAGLGGLVVNEMDANDEWVELFNPTPTPVMLGGVRICDSDAGSPRLDRAFAFPDGFMLGAGEYVLTVEADPVLDGIREGADCPGDGRCLHTDWGLSDSSGETIFILPPEGNDTPLMMIEYPPMAAPDGESYCRIDNGSGDFTACSPTPGAANTAS
ncbi:MAG: lamin tail domain-containing protein [Deltaproteobacteria bacterium]|nr:lamin tail domain-containing protein [Deltaproteobacteria bacterium]